MTIQTKDGDSEISTDDKIPGAFLYWMVIISALFLLGCGLVAIGIAAWQSLN